MQSWMRRFIASPVFEGDEDKTRTANLLNPLLLSLLGMLIIGAVAAPFVFAAKLPSAIAILALFAALLISKLLMHTGRVQQAGLLLVVGLWVPITGLVCLSGGMDSVDIIFYVVLTVMAGLLLGQRAAIVVAVVNIMIGLGTLILEGIGYPLPRIFPYPVQSKRDQHGARIGRP